MPQAEAAVTTKPISEWKSGSEPMTSRQRWFLSKLTEKAGIPMREELTKAEASKLIDELQAKQK
jgi:hypothetical protein